MAVIAGITVFELREGFQESIADGGPRAAKSYLVPDWADRYAVANGLLGLVSSTGNVPGFNAPYTYPDSRNLWCREVTIKGIGSIGQGPKQIAFQSAVVTANFGIPQFNFSQTQDPGGQNSFDTSAPLIFAAQSMDFGVQVVPMPRGTVVANGKTVEGVAATRKVGVVTMNITLFRMPFLIASSVRSLVGQINSSAIFGCAAGTLSFDGIHTERTYAADGTIVQDTRLTFAWRPEAAWNKTLDPGGTGAWFAMTYASGGATTHPAGNFSSIIPSAYTANI